MSSTPARPRPLPSSRANDEFDDLVEWCVVAEVPSRATATVFRALEGGGAHYPVRRGAPSGGRSECRRHDAVVRVGLNQRLDVVPMGCGLSRAHSTEHRIARVYTSSCRGRSAARTLAPGTTGGAMSVKVLLEFQTQADQVDAAKEFLREVLPDTRAYDGFESLTMHQSDDDPTKFLFWEQWM